MLKPEKIPALSEDNNRAIELARAIPFLDNYDLATGKLTLRSATHFPMEIFDFAKEYPVEILNASGSKISVLPQEFGQLNKLRIALFSDNEFEEIPEVFSECRNLSILALKSNRISVWSENALPPSIRWLMLTGNMIDKIPATIGTLTGLQKLALAGNRVESLPEEMALCTELELFRISANNLKSPPPEWLFRHPKLSWYADSGNPFCRHETAEPEIEEIAPSALDFSENDLIGESPSSRVFRGTLRTTGEAVAVKIFKRGLTSDGFPEDDMRASIAAGTHRGLIKIKGKLSGHPLGGEGIVMTLVPSDYKKLGHPPDFKTCTRDTYPTGTSFSVPYILSVLKDISSACEHLHIRGISHGDIYAHNTLSNSEGCSLLGDFGAATFYDKKKEHREPLDVRAFGCLMEDLLERFEDAADKEVSAKLRALQQACKTPTPSDRPSFKKIGELLSKM